MRVCFVFPFFCLILVELVRHRNQQKRITSPLQESTPYVPNLSFANTLYHILARPSNSNSFQRSRYGTNDCLFLFHWAVTRVIFPYVCSRLNTTCTPFLTHAIRLTTQIRLNEHRIDVIYREIQDRLNAYTHAIFSCTRD